MLLFCIVLIVSSVKGSSSNTVVTYTNKTIEVMPCVIDENTASATWRDVSTDNFLYTYIITSPDIQERDLQPKHENFRYSYVPNSHLNLIIDDVERDDEGTYSCDVNGQPSGVTVYYITVEVLAKPTVKNGSQDVDELDVIGGTSYDLTCYAVGARSVKNLSLIWDPLLEEKTPLIITPSSDNYKDYSITSTYIAKKGDRSITCQLTGYEMQTEIDDQRMENISHTVNLNVRYAPICNMTIEEVGDCRNVTLTCDCDAEPADITQYSFFDPSLIYNGANNTFTASIAYGTLSSFFCSATNSIGPGNKTDPTVHNCDEGTTVPQSTNEPTSAKAMGTTTVEPESTSTDNPESGALGTGAIVGISLGALAVVIVIVVIAVIMCKKGKCGSKSDSDKPDDNEAGPGVDPEIPAYGVIDKNRTKDPTPAPLSSMRDSTNSSKPKQDMKMQYADLDHGNKPPSDEVRKPQKEPTEYATVQPVIV